MGFFLNSFLLLCYQLQKQAKTNSPAENIDMGHIMYQLASMHKSYGIFHMTWYWGFPLCLFLVFLKSCLNFNGENMSVCASESKGRDVIGFHDTNAVCDIENIFVVWY